MGCEQSSLGVPTKMFKTWRQIKVWSGLIIKPTNSKKLRPTLKNSISEKSRTYPSRLWEKPWPGPRPCPGIQTILNPQGLLQGRQCQHPLPLLRDRQDLACISSISSWLVPALRCNSTWWRCKPCHWSRSLWKCGWKITGHALQQDSQNLQNPLRGSFSCFLGARHQSPSRPSKSSTNEVKFEWAINHLQATHGLDSCHVCGRKNFILWRWFFGWYFSSQNEDSRKRERPSWPAAINL